MRDKLPVVVKIGDKTYDLDYENELKCAEVTINDDLKDQPSLYAWYAVLQEFAEGALQDAKLALEMTEAKLDSHYRAKLSALAKVTEAMVMNAIRLDEDHLQAITAFNEAKRNVGVLRAIKEAFSHRKDMLVTLASNMRATADPEIFIAKNRTKE